MLCILIRYTMDLGVQMYKVSGQYPWLQTDYDHKRHMTRLFSKMASRQPYLKSDWTKIGHECRWCLDTSQS
jgi:hypothetical protein